MASTLPSPNSCCTPCGEEICVPTPINDVIIDVVDSLGITVGFFQFDTIADLRAQPGLVTNKHAWVIQSGGGIIREWYYDADSTATDDGTDSTTAVKPANINVASPGRWLEW